MLSSVGAAVRRQILSISYDPVLLRTRELLLEREGCAVISVQGFTAALHAIETGEFDLAIIGHSIPRRDQQAIIAEINNRRPIPTVALLRPHEGPVDNATCSIDAADPQGLIALVHSLLPEDAATAEGKSG